MEDVALVVTSSAIIRSGIVESAVPNRLDTFTRTDQVAFADEMNEPADGLRVERQPFIFLDFRQKEKIVFVPFVSMERQRSHLGSLFPGGRIDDWISVKETEILV